MCVTALGWVLHAESFLWLALHDPEGLGQYNPIWMRTKKSLKERQPTSESGAF